MIAASRLFLGAMFAVAAWGKLKRPSQFLVAVGDYRLLPQAVVPWVAAAMPGVELLAAAVLLLAVVRPPAARGRWPRAVDAAQWVVAAMLAVFTAAIAVNLLRGVRMNCGCFDVLGQSLPFFRPRAATWWTVVRDLVFLVPAVALLRARR